MVNTNRLVRCLIEYSEHLKKLSHFKKIDTFYKGFEFKVSTLKLWDDPNQIIGT